MYYKKLVKKSKVLRCRTDKTKCRTPCPKCIVSTGHSKLFKSTENLWRHLWQNHALDKNEYPTNVEVVDVLEEISIALHNDVPLTTILRAVKLGMIIR